MRAPTTLVKNFTSGESTKLLSGVALNATASLRTVTLDLNQNWSKLIVAVYLDYTAATDLTITPSASLDGTLYFPIQTISSGTASNYTVTKTAGADTNLMVSIDVRGYESVQLVFSGTSGGASDLIDVYCTACTGY